MAPFEAAHNFQIVNSTFNDNGNGRDNFTDICDRLASFVSDKNDSRAKYENHLRNREQQTGDWLLVDKNFVNWTLDSSQFQILWVHGQPGSGKSVLCSHAIDNIRQDQSNVLSYYFCGAEQEYRPDEVLGLLAYQLLSKKIVDLIPSNILSLPPLRTKETWVLKSLIKAIVEGSSRVYFFIDGLDEELEGRSTTFWRNDFIEVLQFMVHLTQVFPATVRIWFSSQNRTDVRSLLQGNAQFRELDITPFSEIDIKMYLAKAVEKIHGASRIGHTNILHELQNRAKCSFIWAKLMMLELEKGSTSVSSMASLLEKGFPKSLDTYYQRIFNHMEEQLRPIARQVYSLIVYARRPLRFAEIFEAVWCLNSRSKEIMDPNDQTFKSSLNRIFEPCIEKISQGKDTDNDDNHTCHLIHSTLRTFLLENPNILCEELQGTPFICPQILAEACLTYLRQERYSELLKIQDNTWVDRNSCPVKDHHLLVYAAKYWDKHISDISDVNAMQMFSKKIEEFMLSPQFITCVQVQSVWVESQFVIFTTNKSGFPYFRRHLPSWFSAENDLGKRLWKQYRQLLHDWHYFLSCGDCDFSKKCLISEFRGEVDRVWFGALGKDNFLGEFSGKYRTFTFQSDAGEPDNIAYCLEHLDQTGENLYAIQIPSNADILRIGNKILRKTSSEGKISPLFGLDDFDIPYIEDISYRSSDYILVLTSRTQISRRELSKLKNDLWGQLDEVNEIDENDMSDSGSDECLDCSSGDGADSGSDDCSSFLSSNSELENDRMVPWVCYLDGEREGNLLSDDETGSNPDQYLLNDIYDDISSSGSCASENENDEKNAKGKKTVNSNISSDEEDEEMDVGGLFTDMSSMMEGKYDWEQLPKYMSDKDAQSRTSRASIMVFDIRFAGEPSLLFEKRLPLKCKLYGSPPVIHPKKSLLVWPLADGDVIFIDFERRTYFTRRLRPSTVNITWTEKNAYLTASQKILRTYRIPLFNKTDDGTKILTEEDISEDEITIATLKKPIFLPFSSSERQVFFFPQSERVDGGTSSNLPSRIIIGGSDRQMKDIEAHQTQERHEEVIFRRILDKERLTSYAPAIGCNFSMEDGETFSGWAVSDAAAEIPKHAGVGHLDHRMEGVERFTEDDCDLIFGVYGYGGYKGCKSIVPSLENSIEQNYN
ncbi:hypothetical protein BDQ17DRAFT_1328707 [Cyathus striatus]|nr:hypothetical protein BDQ17DRAFT_1328707 [Cyathus striatus]